MTELLNKAFEAARKLSTEDQDALGREMLERISADARWEQLFGDPRSRTYFAKMAAEVRADIAAGDVVDGDPGSDMPKSLKSFAQAMGLGDPDLATKEPGADGLAETRPAPMKKRPKAGT